MTAPSSYACQPAVAAVPPTASADLLLMLLADGRLPTSGHTQSGGLEPALANGLHPHEIPAYCRSRLATVTLVEAAVAVVARAQVLAGNGVDETEKAWAARTPSRALRHASHALGRGYRRLARQVWPAVNPDLTGRRDVSRPTVLGVIAAVTNLPADALARLVAYDDAQTVVAAGLKLAPSDPAVATLRVYALHEEIEALATRVATLTDPDDIPACSAPLIEAWAEHHTRTTRRLFHA
ncbi:urease accessory protein [Actinopolymorpha cephalotaxi]|uniref:Urease accessory protein n=1 Tax=Actinopolymorpha cephalotaxi TaxID=504797 RepID=A0A1I3A3P9_9ACTN|nr:urease accessory UreF family protein [Actinopolymorpha cephalotaxi]NYH85357.1 urease accessory protein [Actinopolymorpha cephalotaxi]SFH44782.1 urease accessory protein [Actinopolymorpha cephalotaxi]